MDTVTRPLWRFFDARSMGAALGHARGGGIAVFRGTRWSLLGAGSGQRGVLLPFVDWAVRAVEAPRCRVLRKGPAKGFVRAPVLRASRHRVAEWVARDDACPGAMAPFRFDCVRCAACCFGAEVVLEAADLTRFRAAGRPDLVRRTRGVPGADWRVLPIVPETRACIHLGDDHRCGIYVARPTMCRDFLAGSEHCLTSREEKYGTAFPYGR